jgi:type I restriction enzyme S subunit
MSGELISRQWLTVPLEEVILRIVGGGTPSKSKPEYYQGEIPWMSVKDMSKHVLEDTADHISPAAVENSSTNVIPSGTPIIATRMSLGKIVVANFDSAINQDLKALFLPAEIHRDYLVYWYRSVARSIEQMGTGTTVKGIRLEAVKGLKFALPPLAEQKVIADKLDTLLAQVENTKARLERIPQILKRFRQSVLSAAVSGRLTEEWRQKDRSHNQTVSNKYLAEVRREKWLKEKEDELLQKGKLPKNETWKDKYKAPENVDDDCKWVTPGGWAWTTIDTVAKVTKLAGFEYTKIVEYSDKGEIPVIKAENVGKEGFKPTLFSKVTKEVVGALPRSELNGGETLIVFVGAGVGQVATVPSDQKYFLGPNVAVVKNYLDLYTHRYLEILLRSMPGQKNLLSFSKGAAQPSLSMGQIRKASIPMPPVNEQIEIVRRVDQLFAHVDRMEKQVNNALARVNNLTQSILAKAFRGELTEQWRKDNPELISGENGAEALLERIKAERAAQKPAGRRTKIRKSEQAAR